MKGQALAIAMVVAAGVAMYVMYQSTFALAERDARAPITSGSGSGTSSPRSKRAPAARGRRHRRHPGCLGDGDPGGLQRDARSRGDRRTGGAARFRFRLRRPRVNDLFLRRGRWIEANRPDEILASEGFVIANGLAARRSGAGRHQRTAATAHHRRRRAVARSSSTASAR